jgi:hypothetical protein
MMFLVYAEQRLFRVGAAPPHPNSRRIFMTIMEGESYEAVVEAARKLLEEAIGNKEEARRVTLAVAAPGDFITTEFD